MIIAASDNFSSVIGKAEVEGALELMKIVDDYLPKVFDIVTATDVGGLTREMLELISNRAMTRAEITSNFSNRISNKDIGEILDTLLAQGSITVTSRNNQLLYRVPSFSLPPNAGS